ncbi:MAG: hypothetical protein V4792_16440 [Pseudomonadota bacterium]
MGHLLFIFLHLVAVIFAGVGLFITIPGHLIYAAVRGNKPEEPAQPSPRSHVKCPDCREFVMKDARKCKHCGAPLIPQNS